MNTDKAMYEIQGKKLRDAIVYLMLQMERAIDDEGTVQKFRVRGPHFTGDDYLVVLARIADDGTPQVGFHSASTLDALLIGVASRLRNGTIKWHTDKYAQEVASIDEG